LTFLTAIEFKTALEVVKLTVVIKEPKISNV